MASWIERLLNNHRETERQDTAVPDPVPILFSKQLVEKADTWSQPVQFCFVKLPNGSYGMKFRMVGGALESIFRDKEAEITRLKQHVEDLS